MEGHGGTNREEEEEEEEGEEGVGPKKCNQAASRDANRNLSYFEKSLSEMTSIHSGPLNVEPQPGHFIEEAFSGLKKTPKPLFLCFCESCYLCGDQRSPVRKYTWVKLSQNDQC